MSNKSQSLVVTRANLERSPWAPAEGRSFGRGTSGQTSHFGLEASGLGDIVEKLERLQIPLSPSAMAAERGTVAQSTRSLQEQLFDATAEVKILTSQVAMHFENEWRERLFRQLDRLHDPDEWDEEDLPLNRMSFSTFLKAFFALRPTVRPGLGLTNNGNLIAAWTKDKNRLTLQFMPSGRVKWVISRWADEEMDQVAGDTPVQRLSAALEPYGPNAWFEN